jgi:hypothetical protein
MPAHSFKLIKINEDIQLCSFAIRDMYSNIPIYEIQNIVENIINKHHNISQEQTIEIKSLLNIVLEQYYTEHNRKWYKQNNCLTMWTPTVAILAEVLIKRLEHTVIVDILKKFQQHIINI